MSDGRGPLLPAPSLRLRLAQAAAIARLELRHVLLSRRAASVSLLAALPLVPWVLAAIYGTPGRASLGEDLVGFSHFVDGAVLRLFLLLGCMLAFAGLVRREIENRTLHYAFLIPVRREVTMAGRWAASAAAVATIFSSSTVLALALACLPHGRPAVTAHFLHGPGLAQAAGFVAVIVLATATWGAVFLALGLLARRPVGWGLLVFVLELLRPMLPLALKRLTVSWWLTGFLPLRSQVKAVVGIPAPPPSPLAAAIVLGAVLAVAALVVAWRVRRLELAYSGG